MTAFDPSIVDHVRQAVAHDRYAAYLRNTLMELLYFNTDPAGRPSESAENEQKLFEWLQCEIKNLLGESAGVELVPVNTGIAGDKDYSPFPYTAGVDEKAPSADDIYARRFNLIVSIPKNQDSKNTGVILHTNVDDPGHPPAPRADTQQVFGRGTCGSKTQIALLLAQMKLLKEIEEKLNQPATRGRIYQFVIDGNINGNGSLSLTTDPRFDRLPILMHKCTNLIPACGQPGLIKYQCRLSAGNNQDISGAELFPLVVQELKAECRQIQNQSNHPMFSAQHVFSNHRLAGPNNTADLVNDRLTIEIIALAKAHHERVATRLTEFLEDAVMDYVSDYGDATKQKNPSNGNAKLTRHFDLQVIPTAETQNYRIDVYGLPSRLATGGGDNVITKTSYLLGGLIRIAPYFPGIRARARFADPRHDNGQTVLEGIQSFTPSHSAEDLKARLTAAATKGVQQYCRIRNRKYDDSMVDMTFDSRDENCNDSENNVVIQALSETFSALGEPVPTASAWNIACEAGIYLRKGHPVAVFGPGKMQNASTPDESVTIPDLQKALAVATLATWNLIQ